MFKVWRKPESISSAPAEKLTLERVRERVRSLRQEWPKHREYLPAVEDWLTMTRGQLDQVSNRLVKLSAWIKRYNDATQVAQSCLHFRGSVSAVSPSKAGEDWEKVAGQIDGLLTPVKLGHGHCAADIKPAVSKETGVFTTRDFAISKALDDCETEIDRIKTSLSVLRTDNQGDAEYKKAFNQIRDSADNLAENSVDLCLRLYTAISELVEELRKPIREL